MTRAIEAIAEHHGAFGEPQRNSVRAGTFCVQEPEASARPRWHIARHNP